MSRQDFWHVTRRSVLKTGAAISAVTVASKAIPFINNAVAAPQRDISPQIIKTTLTINGEQYDLSLDSRTTLLDALRDHIQLNGSKKGCDHGQCGACTVLVNDRRINACLTLAAMHDGDTITTIEGIGTPDKMHPMQTAFVKHDGFQCGYCTVGQICSAIGMIREIREGMPSHVTQDLMAKVDLNDEEIRERMSGNLCRCAAYPNIVAAIKDAESAT
jgi:xanthine dehydrogenase YagT iron-sulfur-binding subunit